ncbi:hypothetical protein [Streptomyces sp. NPDC051219]|uniref:hypothetical protein n=1 Tax=Streptomyces sp. NPDC051219 TaxID=3155283 RepID=UPI0034174A06
MRLLRRLAATPAAALALGLVLAPGAVAGGPTSVIVVSPNSGEATALYHSAAGYGQLEKLLGQVGESGPSTQPDEAEAALTKGGPARQLNMTWLIHDVSVWRVDRVFVPKTGPVWINTSTTAPRLDEGFWHKAESPDKLRGLLRSIGVLGELTDSEPGGMFYPPDFAEGRGPTTHTEKSEETAAEAAVVTSRDESAEWWWLIPGLVLGLAVGGGGSVLFRRWAARPETPPPGPRQQLLDA